MRRQKGRHARYHDQNRQRQREEVDVGWVIGALASCSFAPPAPHPWLALALGLRLSVRGPDTPPSVQAEAQTRVHLAPRAADTRLKQIRDFSLHSRAAQISFGLKKHKLHRELWVMSE